MRETWSSWSALLFREEAQEATAGQPSVGAAIGRFEVAADRLARILERVVAAGTSRRRARYGPVRGADLVAVTGSPG